MKVSDSGSPIQTGRGLEDVKRRIAEAFAAIHYDQPAPPPAQPVPQVYTEEHAVRFESRAKKLTQVALTSPQIVKSASRSGVFEIVPPCESAQMLFDEALRGFKRRK
jgi:hypothetical protein